MFLSFYRRQTTVSKKTSTAPLHSRNVESTSTRSIQTVEQHQLPASPVESNTLPQDETSLPATNSSSTAPLLPLPQSPTPEPILLPPITTAPLVEPTPGSIRAPVNANIPMPITQPSPEALAPTVNFNNVSMIEYIRFISRISDKNFIFDEEDLLFNVTIVSQEPTSIENLMEVL